MEENAMSFFDFTEDEAEQALNNIEMLSGRKDGRICLCGHSNGRHTVVSGILSCQAAKQFCPCKKLRLVVECSNTRPFLRKTSGAGPLHALSQGISSAIKAGYEIKWLVDMECDKCQKAVPVSPVPVSQRGVEMDEATGYDALLCRDCRAS